MPIDYRLALLPCIAFAAFTLKGATGFGPAIVVVSIGSLILPPHLVIAVSAILDTLGGIVLLRYDRSSPSRAFWALLGVAIVCGSILGGVFLRLISPDPFKVVLGITILLLGFWFILVRARDRHGALKSHLPRHCSPADFGITAFAGTLGGLVGIDGPPIVWHFGRRFEKEVLRGILIRVFLAAALARVVTYSAAGLVNPDVLLYTAAAVPGLAAGVWLGNRVFFRISEATFSRITGAVLLIIGVRLLFG
jgi:uncharacterized membrane protein YfcA